MKNYQRDFIQLSLSEQILRFGQFELKSGRISPYFFNAGLFNNGQTLDLLGQYYAAALKESGVAYDMLFGPAYKGIPLVASLSIALHSRYQQKIPYAYNRKEIKDHGEGGNLVGRPLSGRVLIVDDVISAGTSVRESVTLIEQAGATVAGILIALDRQEKGTSELSAVEEVKKALNVPVISIANLNVLITFLQNETSFEDILDQVNQYRTQFGVN